MNSNLVIWLRNICIVFAFCVVMPISASSLWVGQSITCDASSAAMGLTSDITWTTNGGYISLNGTGFYRTVTATKYWSGTATVTCTWKYRLYANDKWTTQKKTWSFTCNENPVSISPSSIELSVGASDYVTYSHKYSNEYTSSADAYYSSSNTNVATVSSSGKVTGIASGTCYITVYSKLANAVNAPSCKVTVKKINPTGVSLPPFLKLNIEETRKVEPTLTPSNATTSYTWSSENKKIANVDSEGRITGVSNGNTKIWVKTDIGNLSASMDVKVVEPDNILITCNPKDNASNVSTKTKIELEYSLEIFKGPYFNKISLRGIENSSEVPGEWCVLGKKLAFNPTNEFEPNTDYLLSVPTGALCNKWGTDYKNDISIHFRTGARLSDIKYINVWMNDGSAISFLLAEKPRITLNNTFVYCKTEEEELTFPLNQVHKYTLEANEYHSTSISNHIKNGSVRYKDNIVFLDGLASTSIIQIYNQNGILVESYRIGKENSSMISLEKYMPGIYIVRINDISYKLIKK